MGSIARYPYPAFLTISEADCGLRVFKQVTLRHYCCVLSNGGCPTFAPAYPDFLLRSARQDRVCGFR